MADSLYVGTDHPAGETAESPGPTVGTVIVAQSNGTITHLKWHAPIVAPSNAATLPFLLYDATTQDLLASVVPGALTLNDWNTVALPTPVPVVAGQRLIAAVYTANRYVFTGAYFAGGVSKASPGGHLLAPSSGEDPIGNGRFRSNELGVPNSTFNGNNYWTDVVFEPAGAATNVDAAGALALPLLGAVGQLVADNPIEGALALPPLSLTGELDQPGEAAGDLVLPALGLTGSLDLATAIEGALELPVLGAAGSLSALVTAAGALSLPALDLLGTAAAEGGEPVDPGESAIPGAYRDLVAGLKAALRPHGLRVRDDVSDTVGKGDVIIGPPSFQWESLCDPDEPDSITFSLYLIEKVGERAIDNLLAKLPALIRGVQAYRDATITGPVVPGSFPAGSSDLPCYQLTVEMTL